MFIGEDISNENHKNNYKNWFYFSIKNKSEKSIIHLTIKGFWRNFFMWKNGFLPVYKSSLNNKWRFLPWNKTNIEITKKSLKIKIKLLI